MYTLIHAVGPILSFESIIYKRPAPVNLNPYGRPGSRPFYMPASTVLTVDISNGVLIPCENNPLSDASWYGTPLGNLLICTGSTGKVVGLRFNNCFGKSVTWNYRLSGGSLIDLSFTAETLEQLFADEEKACNFRRIVLYKKTTEIEKKKLPARSLKCLITKSL
jgi:hypothetical protein